MDKRQQQRIKVLQAIAKAKHQGRSIYGQSGR
jgi:hypothetical protein